MQRCGGGRGRRAGAAEMRRGRAAIRLTYGSGQGTSIGAGAASPIVIVVRGNIGARRRIV
jgi:hypothetical protein